MADDEYVVAMGKLLALSERMLDYLQQQNWLAARDLERERQALIAHFPPLPAAPQAIEQAHALAARAEQCNRRLLELGRQQLQRYTRDKAIFDQRRRAVQAYSSG